MDFLTQHNRRVAGEEIDPAQAILATGKRVAIIGGGDTGADCLGTSHRQKAATIYQFEHNQQPPPERSPLTPWPLWPMMLRMESSHEEGGLRDWAVATTGFSGNGHVQKLHAVRVGPKPDFAPLPGTEFTLDVDLVLLAMGYSGPRKAGLVEQLGLAVDTRGNLAAQDYATSVSGIFTAGDARRGQSLVVWAIAEGRQAAAAVDLYLSNFDGNPPR
jgi:glutamate synthase (NADPH/NADH) small chain